MNIGGGSTELIIGKAFEPVLLNSTQMGCVSYTTKFFANGKLSAKNFSKAILSAQQRLEALSVRYKKKGWEVALGSSGTIKAIREVLIGLGHEDGLVTHKRLYKLIDTLCEFNTLDDINLTGLTDERKPVFAAGVAILTALFESLKIREMHFSAGALREGLLYEMEERFQRSDIRMRTTENLAAKHFVDLEHAAKVRGQAVEFLNQTHEQLNLKKKSDLFSLLEWSALLHEVGLSISYQAFHKHSSYILTHTNMPGFNSEQQRILATLARYQRKSLKLQELPEFSLFKRKHILGLIRILRLAIIVNGQRNDELLPLKLTIVDDIWTVSCEQVDWLEQNRLLSADLQTEQNYWQAVGWQLEFN